MGRSFRLSKTEAEQKALTLARAYLLTIDTRGWTCECVGASPDPVNPDSRGRKTPRRWHVCVERSQNGNIADGPGIIIVDVEAETVQQMETL